jgi:membrane protease YdiL (CAAX protease family)
MSPGRIKTALVVSLLILAGLTAYVKFFGVPQVYFQYLDQYVYFIGALWLLVLILHLIPTASRAAQVMTPILLGAAGYAMLEIIYNRCCIKISPHPNHSLDIIIGDINCYFLHRSYQYIPLLLMFFVLFRDNIARAQSFLKGGNWNVETDVLGGTDKMLWKKVILKICLTTVILATIALVLRISLSSVLKTSLLMRPLIDQAILFPSNILGAVNNCFIEEFLFRGMLLSIFSKAIGNKWGNILQALLFGLIHYPSFNMAHYIAKVVVFSFIGWLFGRATIETGGIKSSWLMHSVIVISM